MTKPKTRHIDIRVDETIFADFKARLEQIGYTSMSDILRDAISLITYGTAAPGCPTKADPLQRYLSGLTEPYMTVEDMQKLKERFIEFMEAPDNQFKYYLFASKMDEDTLLRSYAGIDGVSASEFPTSDMVTDYFNKYNEGLTPNDLRALLHAYMNDPVIRRKARARYTDIIRHELISNLQDKQEERT